MVPGAARVAPVRTRPMPLIPRSWNDALTELRHSWRPLAEYQVWFAVLGALVVGPAAAWGVERIVATSGHAAVSNYDLLGFFLSLRGALLVLLAAAVVFGVVFTERAGLMLLMAPDGALTPTPLQALRRSLRRFGALARLGILSAGAVTLALIPFAGVLALVASASLGQHDINYYLHERPPQWWRVVAAAGVLGVGGAVAALVVWYRTAFAVPLLLFGDTSPRAALVQSWRLTRGRGLRLLLRLGGWWLAVILAAALANGAVVWLAGPLLQWVGLRPAIMFALVGLFGTALTLISVTAGFLGKSGEALLVLRAYRDVTGPVSAVASGGFVPAASTWLTPRAARGIVGVGFLVTVGLIGGRLRGLRLEERVAITAHRAGAVQGPENTVAALRLAIAAGAEYAEIDVQRTRDGAVVVLHDRDLARVAGDTRRVEDLTLGQLQQVDVGRAHGSAFAGERVPTLAEMIAAARGRIRLNIELKYNRPDPELAAAVVAILVAQDFTSQAAITSLDYEAIRAVEALGPALETGLIVTRTVGNPANLVADFLAVNRRIVTADLVARARRAGKPLHVWTVNDEAEMIAMIERGVANLITDHPATAVAVRAERAEMSGAEKLALRLRNMLAE